jgi:hypothetical protein
MLPDLRPEDTDWAQVVTVIDVPAYTEGHLVELIMNADMDQALAYLKRY